MNNIQEFSIMLEKICKQTKLRDSATKLSESQDFIYSNHAKLLDKYCDHWIAVHKKKVIATDKDLLNLVLKLRKTGVPLKYVALDMLSSEEIPVAL